MSVYGGDSWVREEQQRKRRVEQLLTQQSSSFKKLSNGKYTCLLCPHNPIIDSPLFFSTHCNGSRHRAAESRQKERELNIRQEINKRIAVSSESPPSESSGNYPDRPKYAAKPLISQKLKATSEILNQGPQNKLISECSGVQLSSSQNHLVCEAASCTRTTYFPITGAAPIAAAEQHINYRDRQERELKFTAAGWKRDCHGKWFKDENVEFDSDEEDPNFSLGC